MSEDLLDPSLKLSNSPDDNQKNLPNATAVLVLGIISIVGCIFYGVPGLICGIIAIALHNKDKQVYLTNPEIYDASFKNSKAGLICGIVGLSLSVLFLIFLIVYLLTALSVLTAFR